MKRNAEVGKTIDINAFQPHKISEVICIDCGHRFISVRPEKVLLKELKCSKCNLIGKIIETGEE